MAEARNSWRCSSCGMWTPFGLLHGCTGARASGFYFDVETSTKYRDAEAFIVALKARALAAEERADHAEAVSKHLRRWLTNRVAEKRSLEALCAELAEAIDTVYAQAEGRSETDEISAVWVARQLGRVRGRYRWPLSDKEKG